MSNFVIDAAVRNHKGRIRQNNEDSFYLDGKLMALKEMDAGGLFKLKTDSNQRIFAVCDGMGGTVAGEEASHMAVQTIARNRSIIQSFHKPAAIIKMVRNLSDAVHNVGKRRNARSGATLTMCLLNNEQIRLVHVGDSRIYMSHGDEFKQMTEDHSEVQRMISLGILTKEEAKDHPKRHVINQYLGISSEEEMIDPGITDPLPLRTGDRYLLCSDGLTDMVGDVDIQKILAQSPNAAAACDALVNQALKNGGKDNVTVMCLYVGKEKKGSFRLQLDTLLMGLLAGGALLLLADLIYRMF